MEAFEHGQRQLREGTRINNREEDIEAFNPDPRDLLDVRIPLDEE